MLRPTIGSLGLVTLLSLLATSARAEDTMAYAGTIRDVDLERGAFVLNDVGPRLASTPAPVSARTIALTPGTVIVEAQRAQDSDSGFPGDYATTVTTRAELDEGEFVAVECEPGGVTCEAVEITLVRTDRAG